MSTIPQTEDIFHKLCELFNLDPRAVETLEIRLDSEQYGPKILLTYSGIENSGN